MAAQEVCLRLNTSTSPAILHGEAEEDSFTYLVMPVQIRS
jgi:DNA polymerase III sliding clamp (beta) subunit (PCNA family)